MRRLGLPLLLALAACESRSPAPPPAAPQPTAERRLVILHTNDLHGRIKPGPQNPGLEAVAAHIRKAKQEALESGARVLLVDCGDFFQGTFESDSNEGRAMVEVLNDLGYDALALGNHDFDFGPKVAEALAALAKFPFLGANICRAGSRTTCSRSLRTATRWSSPLRAGRSAIVLSQARPIRIRRAPRHR